eukprot:1568354-Ditylum_brightwellii.AAC.1
MKEINKISFLATDYVDTGLVESTTSGSLDHTNQLKVMNYEEVMSAYEAEEWVKSATKEHATFMKYKVWVADQGQ